jgi:hypothetical protein
VRKDLLAKAWSFVPPGAPEGAAGVRVKALVAAAAALLAPGAGAGRGAALGALANLALDDKGKEALLAHELASRGAQVPPRPAASLVIRWWGA